MANGLLAQTDLSAAVMTTIYTVPTGVISSFSINICNFNPGTTAPVALYVDASATTVPRVAATLEPGIILAPRDSYERTGLVLGAGQVLQAYTDYTSCVAVQVYGFEESAS